jgi:hypothetical protein
MYPQLLVELTHNLNKRFNIYELPIIIGTLSHRLFDH